MWAQLKVLIRHSIENRIMSQRGEKALLRGVDDKSIVLNIQSNTIL